MLPWGNVFHNGIIRFNTVDAYAFLYQAHHIDSNNVWVQILKTFNSEIAAAFIPVLLFLFCIPVIYFICDLIFNSREIAGMSTCLFCVMPGELLHRTSLGAADHHALEIFLFLSIILCILASVKYKEVRILSIICAIAYTVIYFNTWGGALVLPLILGLWGIVLLSRYFYNKNSFPYWFLSGVIIAIPILLFTILQKVNPVFTDKFLLLLSWQNTTVAEEMPLLMSFGTMDMTVWMQNYAMAFYTGLIGIGILAYDCYKSNNSGKWLLLIWSVVMLVLTLAQRRWTYYSEINFAILTVYAGYFLITHIRTRAITAILLLLIVFVPCIEQSVMMGISSKGYIPDDMYNAILWLDKQPNGKVLSQWDNGYWIQYYSNNLPYTTPSGSNKDQNRILTENIFKSTGNIDSYKLTGCRYILLDRKTVEGLNLPPGAYINRLWNYQVQESIYSNKDIKIFALEPRAYTIIRKGENMWLLTDEQIRNAIKKANDEAQLYGDDGIPLPEKEVSLSQLRHIVSKLSPYIEQVISEDLQHKDGNILIDPVAIATLAYYWNELKEECN